MPGMPYDIFKQECSECDIDEVQYRMLVNDCAAGRIVRIEVKGPGLKDRVEDSIEAHYSIIAYRDKGYDIITWTDKPNANRSMIIAIKDNPAI